MHLLSLVHLVAFSIVTTSNCSVLYSYFTVMADLFSKK